MACRASCEARVRIERHFRERAEAGKVKGKRLRYFWGGYYNTPLSQFTEEEEKTVKTGPAYTETYEDA